MKRILNFLPSIILGCVVIYGLWLVWKWGITRHYVPPGKALLVVSKFGKDLPADQVVVSEEQTGTYKGVQQEVLGPGRYFINPIFYTTELVDLVSISAGDPSKWAWDDSGHLTDEAKKHLPQVGIVTRNQGKQAPAGVEVVPEGFKGIQRRVLTPGVYRINKQFERVDIVPALVIPPGSVGVVTRLYEAIDGEVITPVPGMLPQLSESAVLATTRPSTGPDTRPAAASVSPTSSRRGILKDVLQPGIYYLNPRLYKVATVPVGYEAQPPHTANTQQAIPIKFSSKDGYQIEADFTVIWGLKPEDAPSVVASIGNWDQVRDSVIQQAMISACQSEGARYTAKQLIEGASRLKFQDDLATTLESQVKARNLHILLALVRNINIKEKNIQDATGGGLLDNIQNKNIEIERQLTNKQKTETEKLRAELAEELKKVETARQTTVSETNIKVAQLRADGQKKAAEIDADRQLQVSKTALEIAQLESQRTQILARAEAEVARLRNDAEAQGAKLLIDAFGSPQAYNNYLFAKNFKPTELRMIFAGPGTLWTDLKSFTDINGAQQQQQRDAQPAKESPTSPPVRR